MYVCTAIGADIIVAGNCTDSICLTPQKGSCSISACNVCCAVSKLMLKDHALIICHFDQNSFKYLCSYIGTCIHMHIYIVTHSYNNDL